MDLFILVLVITLIVWGISSSKGVRQQPRPDENRACARCGTLNPAPARFCRHCGTRLA